MVSSTCRSANRRALCQPPPLVSSNGRRLCLLLGTTQPPRMPEAQDGAGRPNSPSLAPPRNASHSDLVKIRAGPWGCRELRIAISPPARKATSTQLPPVGPLRRLLIHLAPVRVLASMPLRMLLMGTAPYPRAGYEGFPWIPLAARRWR